MAMFQQGKYRFWRMVMSCKQRDFSLVFKGQYFGIYHMKIRLSEQRAENVAVLLLDFRDHDRHDRLQVDCGVRGK